MWFASWAPCHGYENLRSYCQWCITIQYSVEICYRYVSVHGCHDSWHNMIIESQLGEIFIEVSFQTVITSCACVVAYYSYLNHSFWLRKGIYVLVPVTLRIYDFRLSWYNPGLEKPSFRTLQKLTTVSWCHVFRNIWEMSLHSKSKTTIYLQQKLDDSCYSEPYLMSMVRSYFEATKACV